MSFLQGKLDRAYFEITNVCNAACDFCPGNKRPPRFVSHKEFSTVIDKLQGHIKHLYFHLMGEPLLHPDIRLFASEAREKGLLPMLTTNGLLAEEKGRELALDGSLKKISFSLHSYEANRLGVSLDAYLRGCTLMAETASALGTVSVFRLWNEGGQAELNHAIVSYLTRRYGEDWTKTRNGYRLKDNIFLEYGLHFDWPTVDGAAETEAPRFCYALRKQIGILSDGTVVPCCLDSEGAIPLGNLFTDSLDNILESPRAKRIYDGFSGHSAVEELCQNCGYATRFMR